MIGLFSFKIASFADDKLILIIMKSFNISIAFFSLIFVFIGSGLYAQDQVITDSDESKKVFGEPFEYADPKTDAEVLEFYKKLEADQSAALQFKGRVNSVCMAKGCWMVLALEDGEQARITFKDYGFFVPADLVGKEVVVNGMAKVAEISEEERRHYAEDAGRTAAEINGITGSKRSYSLIAEGVIVED